MSGKRKTRPNTDGLIEPISAKVQIPPEVCLSILDHLPNRNDVQAFIELFPQAYLLVPSYSSKYWRGRWIRDYNIAGMELPDGDGLNWMDFYLDFDRLMRRNSDGWRNRARILHVLQQTKSNFLDLLVKEQSR
ncbi:uncharacterized protein N7459_009096 [Penicillium hispanicum]|uniref:uncharacterized protein n=1 Tax=Penicillium hispanicum TaxID=1080232 RepID=UPI0025411F99|nr:uncharacterized protein N7459_009096 [Penicillium hispanicum]KAJ5569666.1 hypothetical protein N7459_009096 [Penicillium hispanicum]